MTGGRTGTADPSPLDIAFFALWAMDRLRSVMAASSLMVVFGSALTAGPRPVPRAAGPGSAPCAASGPPYETQQTYDDVRGVRTDTKTCEQVSGVHPRTP
ncbi:hypothetical protein SY2F82_03970 [Streptomyces sp. Y2F8-2]|nr:hypothetical protein SY2F82_03970 [Streptomyces sp. Y2F8-2]